jgi:uncharacterized membrane protein (TIGR02234 family)
MSRGLRLAVGGCLLSGSAILLAGGRTWARVPVRHRVATGHDLVGSLVPFGLVALAGIVAIAATRRWGRVPVGVALAACGVAVASLTGHALNELRDRTLAATTSPGRQVEIADDVHATAWPYVTLAAAFLLAVTGGAVTGRGYRWPALGARYDVPADRPRTDADLWAAQDRGEDPTA